MGRDCAAGRSIGLPQVMLCGGLPGGSRNVQRGDTRSIMTENKNAGCMEKSICAAFFRPLIKSNEMQSVLTLITGLERFFDLQQKKGVSYCCFVRNLL